MDILTKTVSKLALSEWRWKVDKNECPLTMQSSKSFKGVYVTSNQEVSTGQIVTTEFACGTIPTGMHYNRVCHSCFQYPLTKATVRDDCNNVFFCSKNCMVNQSNFLDLWSFTIRKMTRPADDSLILALKILYESDDVLSKILALKTHENDELKASAYRLHNYLVETSTTIESTRKLKDITFDTIFQLLKVIRYNSQCVSVTQLPNTSLLCILPTLARVNHDCRPNTLLIYSAISSAKAQLMNKSILVHMVAADDVQIGTELTMSYLGNLCTPR